MTGDRRAMPRRLTLAVPLALFASTAMVVVPVRPSGGQTSGVSGEAYGHYSKVGLFGAEGDAVGPAPRVLLPSEGADAPLTATDGDGAVAVFGPATVFGGKSPQGLASAAPSGPITVSTVGRPGPGGSVTSTASITLHASAVAFTCDGQPADTKNCSSPGGFGPVVPNTGDELHATCTANERGASGSVRLVNATVARATDENGEPQAQEPLPEHPPVNYTLEGVLTHVGDRWRTVYNEQIVDPDGSITVNAIHMYLLGDAAVGESILGHVRCSMKPLAASPTTAVPSRETPATVAAPPPPPPPEDGSSNPVLPLAVGGAVAAGVAGTVLWSRRRRRTRDASEGPAGEPPPRAPT